MTFGKLKEVILTLENCEQITIPGKYIGELIIDDINTEFRRIACNGFAKYISAGFVAIEICRDANNIDYYPFGQIYANKTTIFNRLRDCDDITSISYTLVDDDGEEILSEEYRVSWGGEDDFENKLQSNYTSQLGNLYILITEDGKDIETVFGDEINDKDAMSFHFTMCEIGDRYNEPNKENLSKF